MFRRASLMCCVSAEHQALLRSRVGLLEQSAAAAAESMWEKQVAAVSGCTESCRRQDAL